MNTNNPLSIKKNIHKHIYLILFILFALWMCIGIFPLVCYETDSQEVILGCDILYYNGWQFPPEYCYEYRMQPLTVITVVALKHILSFLTCEQIYCLLSAISSFVFLIGCIEFAQHITKLSRTKILIAAILLPEMYAIAMYPNSAILAAASFIWAFINIIKKRHWAAILLMCIAPLFRVDVVIVYPAILPLLIFKEHTWKKSILISTLYCVTIAIVGLFLFCLCKADVLSTFGGYQECNNYIEPARVAIATFGFYSITYFILLPIGVLGGIKQKLWKELFLVLLPIILLHFVYRSMGCAAKHYLYIAPFVIIAGVRGFVWLYGTIRRINWLKWLASLSIILVFMASVRISLPSMPWIDNDKAYANTLIKSLFSTSLSGYKLSIGVGAGQFIPTSDEKMLASGLFFYSWYIHSYKSDIESKNKELKKSVDSFLITDIVTIEWAAWAPLLSEYLNERNNIVKYHNNDAYKYFTVSNREKYLTISVDENHYENEACFWDKLKNYCVGLHKESVYVIAKNPRHQLYINSISKRTSVEKKSEILYKINTTNLK